MLLLLYHAINDDYYNALLKTPKLKTLLHCIYLSAGTQQVLIFHFALTISSTCCCLCKSSDIFISERHDSIGGLCRHVEVYADM